MAVKHFVEVSFQVPGFHRWRDAPKEVDFLRLTHRHMFHVMVRAKVTHSDRDLEFFLLQERARYSFTYKLSVTNTDLGPDFGGRSCERLANELMQYLQTEEKIPVVSVSVSEDGENTGIVEDYD